MFRLTEHIERLFNSASIMMMEIPYTVDDLVSARLVTELGPEARGKIGRPGSHV